MKTVIITLLLVAATGLYGQQAGTADAISAPLSCIGNSGVVNAYTCTTFPTFTPRANNVIMFKIDVTNTSTSTLRVNGYTLAPIKANGSNITNGLMVAGLWYPLVFDGTNWTINTTATSTSCASLGGDVTGSCAANTVVKVNGAAVPASQGFVGTNSSNQIVAATAGALPSGTTATTQTQADNSTKVATTAYVDVGLATKAAAVTPTSCAGLATGTLWNNMGTAAFCP